MSKKNGVEREYAAFISYRHKPLDKEAAERIQRAIERYVVPREFRDRVGGRKLGMVFRDEDELPISSSLSDSIQYALERSRFLIVICTPDLPLSKWCEQEIRSFIAAKGRDHVLAVLADGTPEESFSPYMLHTFDEEGRVTGDTEPLAANIAGAGHSIDKKAFRKEVVRLFAALIGCPFDALWQRERRSRLTRAVVALGTVTAALAVFLGVLLTKNARITEQNRLITQQNQEITEQNQEITDQYRQISQQNAQITEQNEQITAQNEQIKEQNEQITEQNRSLRRQISAALVDTGAAQLQNYQVRDALGSAMEALLGEEDRELYDRRAEAVLNEALCAYRLNAPQSSLRYSQASDIAAMAVTAAGDRVFLADALGYVRCVDPDTGAELWTASTLSGVDYTGDNRVRLFCVDAAGLLLCKNTANLMALSLENGACLWRYDYRLSEYGLYWRGPGNNFCVLSPDGRKAALLDGDGESDGVCRLVLLDTADGRCLCDAALEVPERVIDLDGGDPWYQAGAAFSEDGRLLGLALYTLPPEADENGGREQQCVYLVLDAATGEVLHELTWYPGVSWSSHVFYGLYVDPETEDLFCAQYNSAYGGIISTVSRWEEEYRNQVLSNHTPRSNTGLFSALDEELPIQPILADGHIALVFSDNSMYVYDMTDGSLRKSLTMKGTILYAEWLDREQEVMELILDNGWYGIYYFNYMSGNTPAAYTLDSLDQTGLRLALPCRGGIFAAPGEGMYLTVREAQPGALLAAELVSDPAVEPLPEAPEVYSWLAWAEATPGGNTMVFLPGSDLTVILYDPAGAELRRCGYSGYFSGSFAVLDEERFLYGHTVYSLDGSSQPLEGLGDGYYSDSRFSHLRLGDGRLLSVYDTAGEFRPSALRFWVDGAAQETVGTGYYLSGASFFALGENGYFLGRGLCKEEEGRAGDQTCFLTWDVRTGEFRQLEDRRPEDPAVTAALATEKPLFACAYGNGELWLCSLEDGSYTPFGAGYAPGEIRSLGFTRGDGYLLVLTAAGRLDIYALGAGELVYSQMQENLQDGSEGYHLSSCREEGERLHVFIREYDNESLWLCVDTRDWVVTAKSVGVYALVAETNTLYLNRGGTTCRCRVRSLEELAAWAGEVLG